MYKHMFHIREENMSGSFTNASTVKKRQSVLGRGILAAKGIFPIPNLGTSLATSGSKKKILGRGLTPPNLQSQPAGSTKRRLLGAYGGPSSSSSLNTAAPKQRAPGRLTPNLSVAKIRRSITLKSQIPKLNSVQNSLIPRIVVGNSKERIGPDTNQAPAQDRKKKENNPQECEGLSVSGATALPQNVNLVLKFTETSDRMIELMKENNAILKQQMEETNAILKQQLEVSKAQYDFLQTFARDLIGVLPGECVVRTAAQIPSEETSPLCNPLVSDSIILAHSPSKEGEAEPKCNTRKSMVMYNSFRSEFACLRTPVPSKTAAECVASAVTPCTNLSRRLQNQLEDLYDSNSSN